MHAHKWQCGPSGRRAAAMRRVPLEPLRIGRHRVMGTSAGEPAAQTIAATASLITSRCGFRRLWVKRSLPAAVAVSHPPAAAIDVRLVPRACGSYSGALCNRPPQSTDPRVLALCGCAHGRAAAPCAQHSIRGLDHADRLIRLHQWSEQAMSWRRRWWRQAQALEAGRRPATCSTMGPDSSSPVRHLRKPIAMLLHTMRQQLSPS